MIQSVLEQLVSSRFLFANGLIRGIHVLFFKFAISIVMTSCTLLSAVVHYFSKYEAAEDTPRVDAREKRCCWRAGSAILDVSLSLRPHSPRLRKESSVTAHLSSFYLNNKPSNEPL